MFAGLILPVLLAGLAGYAIGFFAQRKFDRGVVPVVLLLLANGMLGVLFFAAGNADSVYAVNWIAECSLAVSVCAAASASWVFTRRHVVAAPISFVLALAAAYVWLQVWFEYVCRTGGCQF